MASKGINKVILAGRLGGNPEIRAFENTLLREPEQKNQPQSITQIDDIDWDEPPF